MQAKGLNTRNFCFPEKVSRTLEDFKHYVTAQSYLIPCIQLIPPTILLHVVMETQPEMTLYIRIMSN